MTTDRENKLYYYKNIVKRHLREIRESMRTSKNDMERSYFRTRYVAQLRDYAKALNVHEKYLDRCIRNKKANRHH